MTGVRLLFTGDIGKGAEQGILDAMAAHQLVPQRAFTTVDRNPVDVLKVAHHGSKTSSSAPWLDTWQPRMAVISVGAYNTYGHPNPQLLERFEERGTEVLRTDRHGEVQMRLRDGGIRLRTKLE
jgi:competence protein ComEC